MDIDALRDITKPDINFSAINDSEKIIENMVEVSNETTNGWYGAVVVWGIFFFLIYTFNRDDWLFRYDFLKSTCFASGVCLIISLLLLSTGILVMFPVVSQMGIIFAISIISIWKQREQP